MNQNQQPPNEPMQYTQTAQVKPPNGMATFAFVASFFSWIWIIGIPIGLMAFTFGGIAYRRAVKEGRQGKGLAIAAIIIAATGWILSFILTAAMFGSS